VVNVTGAGTGDSTVTRPIHRLAVVVFDGTPIGILSFAVGVFDLAVQYGAITDLTVQIVGGQHDTTIRGGDLAVRVPHDLEVVRRADLVIVTDWLEIATRPPQALLDALRAAHAEGARIAGLCSGAFVVAAAGLLDGRPATTHWAMAPALATAHPTVDVRAERLYVDDGDILTAGGGAAGLDLGLHLVRTAYGAEVANRLARYMVFAPHRAGGQAQYVKAPLPNGSREDPVSTTLNWALERLDQPLAVRTMARRAGMSRRNFDRRFQALTGATPAAWYTHQRVLRAQQLLETTDLPVEAVARQCGFTGASTLRPHFRRLVGVAPSAYRAMFNPLS
jgi:transcriptional regulator GlxA family with amidase domain